MWKRLAPFAFTLLFSCAPKEPFPEAHLKIRDFQDCRRMMHESCPETVSELRGLSVEQKLEAMRYERLAWHPPSYSTAILVAEECARAFPALLDIAESTTSLTAKLSYLEVLEEMKAIGCDMEILMPYRARINKIVASIGDKDLRRIARKSVEDAFSPAQ